MKLASPIMLFIFASAGIHAGVVMTSNTTTNITLPRSTGSVMTVKINNPETILKDSIKKITPAVKTAKIKKNVTDIKKSDKEKSVKPISQLTHTNNASQQANSKARVISVIDKELSQHFVYPKLAQKRNWQGKVLLSLRVTASGKINNVQISNSSGYGVLDQAAINALIKVGYLPQISSWLNNDIDLILPVVYQLIES